MSIREKFANGLDVFEEEDFFGEWHSEQIEKVTNATPNAKSLKSRLNEDRTNLILNHIHSVTDKFSYGRTSWKNWQTFFKFADQKQLQGGYSLGYQNAPSLNASKESVDNWVEKILIPYIQSEDAHNEFISLIGEIGCGKSTFNKYVTSNYIDAFREKRIVVSRVEFSKAREFVKSGMAQHPNASIRQLVSEYLTCCLIRDFFSAQFLDPDRNSGTDGFFQRRAAPFWPDTDPNPTGTHGSPFHDFWERELRDEELDFQKNFLRDFARAQSVHTNGSRRSRNNWFSDIQQSPSSQKCFSVFLYWLFESHKFQYFVIIDGLDLLDVSDFYADTISRKIAMDIANWIISTNQTIYFPSVEASIQPRFQVTMRHNTYAIFCEKFSKALSDNEAMRYQICPPDFGEIVEDVGLIFNGQSEEGESRKTLASRYSEVENALANRLGIKPRRVNDLFVHNIRHRKNFFRNVLEETIDGIPQDANLVERAIGSRIDELCKVGKSYRLVELLMHAQNVRYSNFIRLKDTISVSDIKIDNFDLTSQFRDDDLRSGYLANIFNHHIPYDNYGDLEYFLEKLRIVDVLNEARKSKQSPLTIQTIKSRFKRNRWKISPIFESSIAICLRENFVVSSNASSGKIAYNVSPLGRIARENLIYNLSYLENVYFACNLPHGLKRNSRNILRKDSSAEIWSATSLFHAYLMLRFVRTCEDNARRKFSKGMEQEISKQMKAIFDRNQSQKKKPLGAGLISIEDKVNTMIRKFYRENQI